MMKRLSKHFIRICVLVFLFAIPVTNTVFAKRKVYDRIELGYSYIIAQGQYWGITGQYNTANPYSPALTGYSPISYNVTASSASGFFIGNSFYLKKIRRKSILALYLSLMYSEYSWQSVNPFYNFDGSQVITSTYPGVIGNDLNGTTTKISMPIGLDVKIGSDAVCTRYPHIGATIGAGLIPQDNMTSMVYQNGADVGVNANLKAADNLALTPYAKAEISFFSGICFKVRAMYSAGNMFLFDHNNNVINEFAPFTFKEVNNLSVSFIILPFSAHWWKREWYSDYDTEIKNEQYSTN